MQIIHDQSFPFASQTLSVYPSSIDRLARMRRAVALALLRPMEDLPVQDVFSRILTDVLLGAAGPSVGSEENKVRPGVVDPSPIGPVSLVGSTASYASSLVMAGQILGAIARLLEWSALSDRTLLSRDIFNGGALTTAAAKVSGIAAMISSGKTSLDAVTSLLIYSSVPGYPPFSQATVASMYLDIVRYVEAARAQAGTDPLIWCSPEFAGNTDSMRIDSVFHRGVHVYLLETLLAKISAPAKVGEPVNATNSFPAREINLRAAANTCFAIPACAARDALASVITMLRHPWATASMRGPHADEMLRLEAVLAASVSLGGAALPPNNSWETELAAPWPATPDAPLTSVAQDAIAGNPLLPELTDPGELTPDLLTAWFERAWRGIMIVQHVEKLRAQSLDRLTPVEAPSTAMSYPSVAPVVSTDLAPGYPDVSEFDSSVRWHGSDYNMRRLGLRAYELQTLQGLAEAAALHAEYSAAFISGTKPTGAPMRQMLPIIDEFTPVGEPGIPAGIEALCFLWHVRLADLQREIATYAPKTTSPGLRSLAESVKWIGVLTVDGDLTTPVRPTYGPGYHATRFGGDLFAKAGAIEVGKLSGGKKLCFHSFAQIPTSCVFSDVQDGLNPIGTLLRRMDRPIFMWERPTCDKGVLVIRAWRLAPAYIADIVLVPTVATRRLERVTVIGKSAFGPNFAFRPNATLLLAGEGAAPPSATLSIKPVDVDV